MNYARKNLIHVGRWTLVVILALTLSISVSKPIVLTASDMGRHLMNGILFLDHGRIATTNLYSYTYPDFPFLNHHWGGGVFFELARRVGGFVGISIFGITLIVTTAILYLRIAWRRGTHWLTIVAGILVLPIFASRAEIRPELFSYLLSAVFLWILLGVRDRSLPAKTLSILPALLLVWVNLHIYFFLGIGWIGAFLLDALWRAWRDVDNRDEHVLLAKRIGMTLAACCAVTPLNPNGWRGAVYPLFIFQNYAYAVAENQTPIAIQRFGPYPPTFYLIIATAVLGISWIRRLWHDRRERELTDVAILILSLFTTYIAWKAIRNFSIFSYVSIVAISYAWSDLGDRLQRSSLYTAARFTLPSVLLVLLVALWPSYWRSVFGTFGLGVAPNILRSVDFFKEQHLTGPIFNNYDIGGFLTYGLYPQERVFVDNRPEAYPGEFFTDTLLPMQMDDAEWLRVDARYGFKTIFFYRHDATRWGQAFMIRRLQDPAWAPVFVDNYSIILVRRLPEFADVIANYEIPKSRFDVVPRQR